MSKELEIKNDIIEVKQFDFIVDNVRDDLRNNPYIIETIKDLSVGAYRSAIGSFWNAVVDDLRNKIIRRSLDLFNKEMNPNKPIKNYEDFQDNVNDEMLIDGAYKMGIISWEGHKILKHSKETRHVFDGHPRSSKPTQIKVISMMEDCIKYVLGQDYPLPIIDIDEYVSLMETSTFDKNELSISYALDDLPDIYLNKLINMLFSRYVDKDTSSTMRANIEVVGPILWKLLSTDTITTVARRVDTAISSADKNKIDLAFDFIKLVDGLRHLSAFSKKYLLEPIVSRLESNLDNFTVENDCVDLLLPYSSFIPRELGYRYVNAITQTYVGKTGSSYMWKRTDFYADRASIRIPKMFEVFDSYLIDCFAECIRKNTILKDRISHNSTKMRRLRSLGNILLSVVPDTHSKKIFLQMLCDESQEEDFLKEIK